MLNRLRFRFLSEMPKGLMSIDERKGIVRTASRLDRDTLCTSGSGAGGEACRDFRFQCRDNTCKYFMFMYRNTLCTSGLVATLCVLPVPVRAARRVRCASM